jgi:hypothetical protein
MSTAENAKLMYEAGQNATAMSALTDSGDATTFTSAATLWSGKSGSTPTVRPNGLLTGGAVIPAAAAGNNNVDVAALTCNLQGVVTTVAADTDVAITRPATNVAKVCSITVNNAGTIAVVAGTDGSTTAFSETRAAAGGPPLIPVDSIEIAQVRVTTSTAAVITADQIFAVVGTHTEMANYPLYNLNYAGGTVTFLSALPKIHTGTVAKKVYASYAAPIFGEISLASDFVAPETSHSVSSTQIYGTTLGSTSSTLGQGSFTAYLEDGVTDGLVALKNEKLWFKFYPDRYKSPYILAQGKLGIARTFPAGDSIQAACTISAEASALEVAS